MEKVEEKMVVETSKKLPKSKSTWTKQILMLLLIAAAFILEIYGFEFGYLRYMGVVMILLVAAVGLEGFTNSYNQLLQAEDAAAMKSRLKLSAEKAAALGVVSLTLGVALGLYSFDAVNSDANSKKLLSVQEKTTSKAKQLGCEMKPTDSEDCKGYHEALNVLWTALWASDVKGMATGVDNLRTKWQILSIRWPHQHREEFIASIANLDRLKYWSDTAKQQIALLLAVALLPFSVAATSRKLAVAAFEAKFSSTPVTWGEVIKRTWCNAWAWARFKKTFD